MYMARRTRKTRRKRYSPSPRRSRTKTKTKTPTPPKPAGRRARRRRRTALARATRRRGGVGNQGQIAAVRKSLKHVKTKVGKRAPQLPRGDGFHGTNGVEMEMDDWLKNGTTSTLGFNLRKEGDVAATGAAELADKEEDVKTVP